MDQTAFASGVDVPTLRRIALLVLRISQDEPSLGAPMSRIASILEQMKREAALGRPFDRAEVDHLRRLLTRTARPAAAGSIISATMLAELRDLGRALPAD